MTETQRRNELVAQVVAHLPGATLNIDSDGYACRADYADGRQLWFRLDIYKTPNRLEVQGNWPKLNVEKNRHCGPMILPRDVLRGDEVSHYSEITVSAEKSPEQIAKDITRRFLPGYTEMFNRCMQIRDQRDAEATAKINLEAQLAALSGRMGLPDSFTDKTSCFGSVTVHSSTSVEIDIRALTPKHATAILDFLKTL